VEAHELASNGYRQRQMNLRTDIRTRLLLALARWGLRAEASGARPPELEMTAVSAWLKAERKLPGQEIKVISHLLLPRQMMLPLWDAILSDHQGFRAMIWPAKVTAERKALRVPAGDWKQTIMAPAKLPDLSMMQEDTNSQIFGATGLSMMQPEWLHQWTLSVARQVVRGPRLLASARVCISCIQKGGCNRSWQQWHRMLAV
jgi:hypothetical protein